MFQILMTLTMMTISKMIQHDDSRKYQYLILPTPSNQEQLFLFYYRTSHILSLDLYNMIICFKMVDIIEYVRCCCILR